MCSEHADILAHVHIATVPNRLAPGAEPCDFSPFFAALAEAHYTGRISIEGKIADPISELPVALATMHKLANSRTGEDSPSRGLKNTRKANGQGSTG